jgi:hypothetical protein
VIATRPASFSMSTSRDACRALESLAPQPSHQSLLQHPTSKPNTQGRHHPKYPHLSVVLIVKERAQPGSSSNAGFRSSREANYNDLSSTLQAAADAAPRNLPGTMLFAHAFAP